MDIFVNVIIMMMIVSSSLEFFTHGHPLEKEPTCYSKFDYDAKLLERLLLVEHKMKLVEEKSEKATEDIVKFGEAIKQETDQASTKQTTFMDDVNANMNTAKAELVAQQNAFMDNAKATLERETLQLSADQKTFIDGTTTTLEATQSRINDSLAKYEEEVKKSRAVAFYARYTGTPLAGPDVVLPFSTAILNTNNVYDTQTGYFTAPTAGLYLFSVQICGYLGTNNNRNINFRVYVNDDFISDTSQYDPNSHYHCSTSNAVAILEVGDEVCVKTGPNTSSTSYNTIRSDDYRWSTFLGVRLN